MEFFNDLVYPRFGGARQMLRIMKLITIMLTAFLMQVSAASFSQQLTIKSDRIKIEKVFEEIRKQTGYTVLYRYEAIRDIPALKLDLKGVELEEALKSILKDRDLEFRIEDKAITIKRREPSFLDRLVSAFDNIDVRGRVVDEQGLALTGATVKVKGSGRMVSTDQNGEFFLQNVDEKAVLVVSYIGYGERELKAEKNISVSLKMVSGDLQEVVVNKGYYDVKQKLNMGSVSTVKADVIGRQPVGDPMLALSERIPGLSITQASGIPGASQTIIIRGQNSIVNGNSPLYLVDGIPFNSNSLTGSNFGNAVGVPSNGPGNGVSPFNMLNPADIESITVLKDADATAIYGSRGANGVILITTKKGVAGTTKVDINAFTGAGRITNKLQYMNTSEYLEMRREALKNDHITTVPTGAYDLNGIWDQSRYTDWQDVLIGNTAKMNTAQVTLSGGTTNTQFLIGTQYSNQTTVFPGDYHDQKISGNFNLNHQSDNKKFHSTFLVSYLINNNNIPTTDFTDLARNIAPDAPAIYDSNGNLNWQIVNNSYTFLNPLRNLLTSFKSTNNNLNTSLRLDYEILEGFKIQGNLGYNFAKSDQTSQTPASSFPPALAISSRRNNMFGNSNVSTWIAEPQLSYLKTVNKHNLEVLLGTTFQETNSNSLFQTANDFPSDLLISNPRAAATIRVDQSTNNVYRYNAIYGRISYNYDEKYLLNLTGRRDGSSRFGPDKQFGNFGAIGAGWIFSRERFITDNLPFISFGKLRGSLGITGNDQISDYQYLSTYVPYGVTYQNVAGLFPDKIANPYYAWERNRKLEGGLELGFLKDRFNLSIDYFNNQSGNQLIGNTLPLVSGFNSIQANFPAVVQNTGWEIVVNSQNVKSKSFSWITSFNITIPKNKLKSFEKLSESNYKNSLVVGQPITLRKLLHYTGVDPQTGLYTVEDVNHDGQITYPEDVTIPVSIQRNYYGGLQNTFTYKNWQFDMFWSFVKQNGIDVFFQKFTQVGAYNKNVPIEFLDRWKEPGNASTYQRYSQASTVNVSGSDAIVTDASYIRLKNASISYSLSSDYLKKIGFKNAKIYIQAQNLVTITGYKGYDPETQSLSLPPLRMLAAGFNCSF